MKHLIGISCIFFSLLNVNQMYNDWINMAEYFFRTGQEQWMYLCLMRAAGYLEPGI